MLPQIGFPELLLIGALALIVVGPKDLPVMMRRAGQFFGRLRGLGQEFKDAFDEMGAEGEMAELRKEIEELKKLGSMSNLSDEAFEEDMRALDAELKSELTMPSGNETPKPAKDPND